MAEWKDTFAFDPVSGTTASLLKEGGELYLHHRSDPTALIEENKKLNTQPQKGRTRLGARVPSSLMYHTWPIEFEMKHGTHPHKNRLRGDKRLECRKLWKEFWINKVNSHEYSHLRTDDGKKI